MFSEAGLRSLGVTISSWIGLRVKRYIILSLGTVPIRQTTHNDVKYGEATDEAVVFCAGVKRGLQLIRKETLLVSNAEKRLLV